ncbi:MAG: hypothetical protein EZS28_002419 [Streblomastix strix]|uniref:Uncharacterized protein n=1 Tax=Streblomastix strix TaxID=222440 RepID=A0A5J4X4A8_9EUKA|nr:MAG: hypothetical protein EZS28_002419 [Streblomastix strix]
MGSSEGHQISRQEQASHRFQELCHKRLHPLTGSHHWCKSMLNVLQRRLLFQLKKLLNFVSQLWLIANGREGCPCGDL